VASAEAVRQIDEEGTYDSKFDDNALMVAILSTAGDSAEHQQALRLLSEAETEQVSVDVSHAVVPPVVVAIDKPLAKDAHTG